ncbi:MAG: hypothetical protein NZQ09_17150, partial [Chloroflexus sp.]|nr:hypothetical protein [Chloroflexus sp.]
MERQARQARQARQEAAAAGDAPPAAEPALGRLDPTLRAQVWAGSGHDGPSDATRRALIAALRMLDQHRKGSPARLAALRALLGERGPGTPPPSPFWRAVITGIIPPEMDLAQLSVSEGANLLIAGVDHPTLVARLAESPEQAAWALIARPELARFPALIAAVTRTERTAATVLCRCPAL